jgi:hypothetical protein
VNTFKSPYAMVSKRNAYNDPTQSRKKLCQWRSSFQWKTVYFSIVVGENVCASRVLRLRVLNPF